MKKTTTYALILTLAFLVLATSAFAQQHPSVISVHLDETQNDTHPTITASFSNDMNAQTINTNTFLVTQHTNIEAETQRTRNIEGIVEYHVQSRTATFSPQQPLQATQEFDNVYTVTLLTDIQDINANNLEQEHNWSFVTGESYNATTDAQPTTTTNQTPTQQVTENASTNITAPAATTETSSWWVSPTAFALYSLLALLLITALYLALPTKQTHAPVTQTASPFGSVYPVHEIEGVGDEYTNKLHQANIKDTQQLWMADAQTLNNQTGISTQLIRRWQAMAELMAVKGIGGQYAELLERSGIKSIDALATSNPKTLLRQIEIKQQSIDSSIQGTIPGEAIVESWVRAAKKHPYQ